MTRDYIQMINTASSAGLNVIPKRKQYQLLALAHLYGDESFVFTDRLYTDVMFAAKQCGFKGGGRVGAETRACIAALESEIKEGRADWVRLIEAEYGIAFPQWANLANGQDYWEERKYGSLRVPASQHGEAGQRQPEEGR